MSSHSDHGFGQETMFPAAVYGIRQWQLGLDLGDWPKGIYGSYWPLPQKVARCKKAIVMTWEPLKKTSLGYQVQGQRVHGPEETPKKGCTCGIYAYFSATRMTAAWSSDKVIVTGVIEGSGKTLIGEYGFKTAHAKVLAITSGILRQMAWDVVGYASGGYTYIETQAREIVTTTTARAREVVADLADAWQVPAFGTQEAMLRAFPLTDLARDFPGLLPGGTP